MITQLLEPKTTTSSPLNLTANDEEPLLSFSQLLKGINSKDDSKTIQNGVLVLSLEDTSEVQENQDIKLTPKNETTEQKEIVELNPILTSSMNPRELKTLVLNAKEYLKEKILQSPEYKKAEVIEFPKTLKGLAKLADSFGINVHKISVEEVQERTALKLEPKATFKIELYVHKKTLKTDLKAEVKSEIPKLKEALSVEPKVILKSEQSPTKVTLKTDLKVEVKSEKPKLQEALSVEPKVILKSEQSPTKVTLKTDLKVEIKSEKPKLQEALSVEPKVVSRRSATKEIKVEQASVTSKLKDVVPIEVKNEQVSIKESPQIENFTKIKMQKETTLLFKAQTKSSESLIQSTISTHSFKLDTKNLNIKIQENPKSLLHTKKSSPINSSLTADFVVDTAKVIAPDITNKLSKGLESLLFSQSEETSISSNVESLTLHKTDSFEVKLNEAKQMIKYLSSDVKTAIEDYKSPFTRVKLQLNPQRLGEVDLTIVQRGKNLHINLSSNSTAINTLSMNVNELRVQLNNSGINNATLNFNNSSQSDGSNASQQQNRQNERQAQDEYTYFEHEETDEEILSSLEIVVPDYA